MHTNLESDLALEFRKWKAAEQPGSDDAVLGLWAWIDVPSPYWSFGGENGCTVFLSTSKLLSERWAWSDSKGGFGRCAFAIEAFRRAAPGSI